MIPHTLTPTIIDLLQKIDGSDFRATFAKDVASGLSQNPKQLPSRYFYDAAGSKLFQQIMDLPEYYLTRAEFEAMETHREAMAATLSAKGFFHLVDLGAGDGLKTKLLLHELSRQHKDFDYIPIDISGNAMLELTDSLQEELPDMPAQAVVGEYLQALEWLQQHKQARKALLFLGSNIGNFEQSEAQLFLQQMRNCLEPGDQLLLGIDLCKDPSTILNAYNDASGVTAAFNLNLLHRMNRELGTNLEVDQFKHFALYDPQQGVMRSYLVSQVEQSVYLPATGEHFHFDAWEAIHTENSHKYTLEKIRAMGQKAGFTIETVFQDSQRYFADVLFVAS